MEINQNLTRQEMEKAADLIKMASKVGYDVSCYGQLAVNQTSGNVYLWLEDEPICLFIGPCDEEISGCLTCGNCGHEEIASVTSKIDLLNFPKLSCDCEAEEAAT